MPMPMPPINIDLNIAGLIGLMLGGFGLFVRLTIKGAIADLKDALAILYMAKSEVQERFASLVHRLEVLERKVLGEHAS